MRGNLPEVPRRSSRVPANLPILVTSLAPGSHFSEICETLVVNAHGCSMRCPVRLEPGIPIHFHSREGRETMAKVVDCQPMGPNQQGWRLGARLEAPGNFWELASIPEDWNRFPKLAEYEQKRKTNGKTEAAGKHSLKLVSESGPQLSAEHVRSIIAEFVQPLHAEVSDLRGKLTQGPPKRSQFEVSLNHIPPELEEKLWVRLKQDLGAQALQHTREQTEKLLTTAAITIEKKVADGQEEFRQKLMPEFQAVEQRAQSISADMAKRMREHLAGGLGEFQQQVLDSRNGLQTWSEELVRTLKQRLGEEYEAHRWKVQQVQAAVANESSRMQAQITDLGSRMAKLDESTRRLESELESHLEDMARSIVGHARNELEGALASSLKELETRNAKELATQLDDACAHLKIVQKGVEASAAELLRTQVTQAMQSFEKSMQELARNSVDKWRKTLAGGLTSLVNTLGDQFRMEAERD